MAFGFSAALPLRRNDKDGHYVLTKTIQENTQQNIKNLLLTAPGERVMLPNFGVGLRHYLFNNLSIDLQTELSEKITNQVQMWLPYISLDEIIFFDGGESNILGIRIIYSVPSHRFSDTIDIN
tara:strand:- start:2529 stop:2897 length:369 start_codon:yes stop_codon:yes gene_type:complete